MDKYYYYWYHHLFVPIETQRMINAAIEHHNYEAFLITKSSFESRNEGWKDRYFPMTISKVSADGKHEHIELTEETFRLITHSECECG